MSGADDSADFFGDQTEDDKVQRDREWEALRREHVAQGFREGSERGHETKMQDGFDHGFLAGAKATQGAGYWLGVASLIEAFYSHKKSTAKAEVPKVSEDIINAIKEAKAELEKNANKVVDLGEPIDVSATRSLCQEVLNLSEGSEEPNKSEEKAQSER